MARALDREKLLTAFDEIGRAAAANGTKLQIAVYGGSALMLASNFRFSTEDVDVSKLEEPWPQWLRDVVDRLAVENKWQSDWFNDAVVIHLSSLASLGDDHMEFASFPLNADAGLMVYVPSADYMLALRLKAIRINDPVRGDQERLDILNLMRVVGIEKTEDAIAILAKFFPASGAAAEKQRFLLKYMDPGGGADAPEYPRRGD